MKNRKKMLSWAIPIGIAVILFLALWVNQINNERQLPSPGWSRTVHPHISSTLNEPYAFKDASGIHLFTISDKEITRTTLNDNLTVTHKIVVKVSGDIQRIIWADNSSIAYKSDGNLIYQKSDQAKTVAKGVSDAKANSDGGVLYYAQEGTLHSFNLASGKDSIVAALHDPIQALAVEKERIIVATQDSISNFHFYDVPIGDSQGAAREFASFNGMSHGNISVMDAVQHDGKLGMFFTTHVLSQGEHFYDYYLEFPLNQIISGKPKSINANFITFTVKDTGEYLSTPMNTQLYFDDGKPKLLFSSEGSRTLRERAINIYEGYQDAEGHWMAERRSTSPEISQFPFMVDDQTIGWLDYISDNHFQVGFSSQNPKVVDESMKLRQQDFSHSFSNAALSLSRVFMLFMLMIAYAIPPILVYAVVSFTKVELIERDSQVFKWVLLCIYLVCQYLFVGHTQTQAFQSFAPGYLNFEFSRWVIPTVMAILTYLLVKWVKSKDWGIAIEAFYSIIVFSVMELFTFGPYFF